uniref:Uncharacterized protein n=1 Tax=Tetranychus urticae TaxID=32264 RepID=T1KK34_TETUR
MNTKFFCGLLIVLLIVSSNVEAGDKGGDNIVLQGKCGSTILSSGKKGKGENIIIKDHCGCDHWDEWGGW